MAEGFERFKLFVLDILQTVVIAGAIFIIVWQLLLQPHKVDGKSMEPTFCDKDMILTDKISYRFRKPERFEVIVFKSPQQRSKELIKRVIGLPGDTVEIQNQKYVINRNMLEEPYIPSDVPTNGKRWLREGTSYIIPEGFYFVSGDNREHSEDSRAFEPISGSSIVGRVWIRYWPPSAIGIIPKGNEQTNPRLVTCL